MNQDDNLKYDELKSGKSLQRMCSNINRNNIESNQDLMNDYVDRNSGYMK